MSFKDFITNRFFRRSIEKQLHDFLTIRPPANPSRRYIDKLVKRLLEPDRARAAHKELGMIGAAAVPSLLDALADPRYRRAAIDSLHDTAPLEAVLELLVPHAPDQVVAFAAPLVDSPSEEIRKAVALQLASSGLDKAVPSLLKLLDDPDGYVRSYVCIGVHRAIVAERCAPAFRTQMYDLLLRQCDRSWDGPLNDAPGVVVALDRARAASHFASSRWLSPDTENLHHILQACNHASIPLHEDLLRRLLDHSISLALGNNCYPHQYVAAAALEALTLCLGQDARPLLDAGLDSEQPEIQEAAARGIARLAGVVDAASFVLDRRQAVGHDALTYPQRVFYDAWLFDAEVCNGGLTQFFGNSSGDRAAETLEALKIIGHPQAIDALESAMRLIGPLARENERDMRLAAFEHRFNDLRDAFQPLESAYYAHAGRFKQRLLLYGAAHADHFKISPQPSSA